MCFARLDAHPALVALILLTAAPAPNIAIATAGRSRLELLMSAGEPTGTSAEDIVSMSMSTDIDALSATSEYVHALSQEWAHLMQESADAGVGSVTMEENVARATQTTLRATDEWRSRTSSDGAGAPLPLDDETRSTLVAASIHPEMLPGMDPTTHCSFAYPPSSLIDQVTDGMRTSLGVNVPVSSAERTMTSYLLCRLAWVYRKNCTNLGAISLSGLTPPRIVFRSMAIGDGPVLRSLLAIGGVRHVHNIYGDRYFPIRDLIDGEARACAASNATFETHADLGLWHWLMGGASGPRHGYLPAAATNATAMRLLAQLAARLLRPGGRPLQGNLLVHCAGGSHRTGILVAILRRYLNRHEPLDGILRDFRLHSSAPLKGDPRGSKATLFYERLISEFDLRLLDRAIT